MYVLPYCIIKVSLRFILSIRQISEDIPSRHLPCSGYKWLHASFYCFTYCLLFSKLFGLHYLRIVEHLHLHFSSELHSIKTKTQMVTEKKNETSFFPSIVFQIFISFIFNLILFVCAISIIRVISVPFFIFYYSPQKKLPDFCWLL